MLTEQEEKECQLLKTERADILRQIRRNPGGKGYGCCVRRTNKIDKRLKQLEGVRHVKP